MTITILLIVSFISTAGGFFFLGRAYEQKRIIWMLRGENS